MAIVLGCWFALGGAIGFVWAVRLLYVGRVARDRLVLSSRSHPSSPEKTAREPKVSVIVAAKDEEPNIESCVTTLLDQDYPDFELIIVDDRSGDQTPAILQRLAREAGDRLRVVTVKSLRDGWFGKNNAMREGVAVSTGEWLLFSDADCRQTSTRTVTVAMREALAHQADFLSITPVLETPTWWERIIQPVCALILMLWFLPQKANDPDRKTAYANGAFMMMTRRCYDAIGGHERVRTEVNEDIKMAQYAKRIGFRLRVAENEDLYRTRMYATPMAAWHGWSRIFYGSLSSMKRLVIAANLLTVLTLTPWLSLAVAVSGRALTAEAHATSWNVAVGVWAIVIAVQLAVIRRIYAMMRIPPIWSLTYGVGGLVALGMLISAMFKQAGRTATVWRGTSYRGQVREDSESCNEPGGLPSAVVEEPAPHG